MPASSRRSSTWSMSGFPAKGTSGFGMVSVSGRMRVPLPAAMTIARLIFISSRPVRQMRVEPGTERRQCGMREVAREVIHGARHVRHVLRLGVALEEAGPETDEAQRPLRAEHSVGRAELFLVETGKLFPGAPDIKRKHRLFAFHRHIAARILKEGDDVVGTIADQRILVVDEPDARGAFPVLWRSPEPEHVGRVIIAN